VADVEVFVRKGCPHCARASAWLAELRRERPEVSVLVVDVLEDAEGLERLERLVDATHTPQAGTPAFYVGGELVVGWQGDPTARRVRALLGAAAARAPRAPEAEEVGESLDLPLLGTVRLDDLGLPALTVVLGLVDGFNPCAMWVLVFLLSILVNLKSRAKMLAVAGTFVAVSGLVYFTFMAAWLHLHRWIGFYRGVQVALGLLALLVGVLNVKDFFAFHRGITLGIPEAAKPGIYERVRRILRAPTTLAALAGVVVLAFMVNLVELLCTAGLPAVYTNILARHDLTLVQHYGYLALYQLFYMLDDSLLLLVAVVTLSRGRLQERGGRVLKLVSGLVMVLLALLLLFWPQALAP
jgi:glutaredoxin